MDQKNTSNNQIFYSDLIVNLITNLVSSVNIGRRDLNELDLSNRANSIQNFVNVISSILFDVNKIKEVLLPVIGVILRGERSSNEFGN